MTYNRDLQEDKERLFDTVDHTRRTVRLCAAMILNTSVNREVCATAAQDPALLATDLADYLVRKGLPFRHAHHAVGNLVALSEKLGKRLNQLTLQEFQSVEKKIGPDALQVFDLSKALLRRGMVGAPGKTEVERQLARWKRLLG